MDRVDILNRLSPYVRVAYVFKACKCHFKPRIIFDYELIYLAKGEVEFIIEGVKTINKPGDIILFRPGVEHSFNCVDDGETWMPHLHFDATYYDGYGSLPINMKTAANCSLDELKMIREDILGSSGLGLPDIIRIGNHEKVFELISILIDIFNPYKPGNLLAYKALTLEILNTILIGLDFKENHGLGKYHKNLDKAAAYIAKHYNEDIPNEVLAKLCCLSVPYFRKLFIQYYSVSPVQYQLRYRMERAKELLIYSYMSIMEISERVGYESIHAFSKAFKKVECISPGEFRTKHFNHKIE